MRRRTLFFGAGALIVVVVLVAVGGYLYFFSGLRQAPKPLALSSPPASASPQAAQNLAGKWSVQSGSQVGYRVHEQFVDQSSPHDAVARTSGVSGGLAIQQAGSGLQATAVSITARLAGLHSVDQVAGRDVSSRDRIVSRALDVDSAPNATFSAPSVAIPASAVRGQTVQLTVPGQLTVHDTARPAQANLEGRASGGRMQLAGTVPLTMTDFGVPPPQVPFVRVPPQVTVEVQLTLARSPS
ncbi:MAG: YceI family protein [Candidatus Dormibacteraeota bacterium]|nr:YceI family protein [Candidatus Dormibacteraeota bacterium]MBO0761157.1 YceI family protein [Candidatus Dormibacteraeota bacterium]